MNRNNNKKENAKQKVSFFFFLNYFFLRCCLQRVKLMKRECNCFHRNGKGNGEMK